MLRTVKPKNARSKRALEAREPKEIEDPRTVIFVKGTHTGETVNAAMKELMALKRPNAISFSKKNVIRPFEDPASLEFWADKNDASMFVVGQSTKKRPDNLVFVRMFNHKVLDMCEVGIDKFIGMSEFKTPKSTPGHKPLLHFASELFDSHPRFIQLKFLFINFFNGQVIDSVCLSGIDHIISITLGPTPSDLTSATAAPSSSSSSPTTLPKVHIRTYTVRLLSSGVKTPRVELTPMGPYLDLTLRRNTEADPEMWKAALKKPKMKKQDVEKGLGKKRKNMEVDEMGDLRGRIHVEKQDLSKLQRKKVKGLRAGGYQNESGDESEESGERNDDDDANEEDEDERSHKRRKS